MDDGVRDYPTSGSVTTTNNGKNSIVIGGNIMHGLATLSYWTNLLMLKIDRRIYQTYADSGHVRGVEPYSSKENPATTLNIDC